MSPKRAGADIRVSRFLRQEVPPGVYVWGARILRQKEARHCACSVADFSVFCCGLYLGPGWATIHVLRRCGGSTAGDLLTLAAATKDRTTIPAKPAEQIELGLRVFRLCGRLDRGHCRRHALAAIHGISEQFAADLAFQVGAH